MINDISILENNDDESINIEYNDYHRMGETTSMDRDSYDSGNRGFDYRPSPSRARTRSLNSSYADLFEASDVVIRDQYEGSLRGSLPLNAVTANLRQCKKKVIIPYYKLLCLIGWRPFGRESFHSYFILKVLNIIYPPIVVGLLVTFYIARAWTCQGHLSLFDVNETPATPVHPKPHPANHTNSSYVNMSSLVPAHIIANSSGQTDAMLIILPIDVCRHILGIYVLPEVLHFLAYIIGFYLLRIQENEGLYSLMEKMYLQTNTPQSMTKTLRLYLYVAILWLCFATMIGIFYHYAFGLKSTTGFPDSNPTAQFGIAGLIVVAQMMDLFVFAAVVINYVGQCQLIRFYMQEVTRRLEEKTTELKMIMKNVLDIKQNLDRLNGTVSLITSFIVFVISLSTVIAISLLVNYPSHGNYIRLTYRILYFMEWSGLLMFTLVQASLVTSEGEKLKDSSLPMRVFGFQTHTQLDIDSFLNFLNLVKLEAHLCTIPIKARYLWGFLFVASQIMVLIFQTGSVVGANKWF